MRVGRTERGGFHGSRRSMVAARSVGSWTPFLGDPVRWVTGVNFAFLGHWCGGVCRCFSGEAGVGVWGRTWNRAAWGARGGPGFPPVRFRIGLSFCLFTRVVEP